MIDHANNLPRASAGSFQPVGIERPSDPVQTMAFGLGLVLLFLRTSMVHQLEAGLMGFNLRLLYIFGLPALLGVVLAGGIQSSFRGRPAFFYLPSLAGLAIALDRTAEAEFSSRAALVVETQLPPWGSATNGFQTGAGRVSPDLARTARP